MRNTMLCSLPALPLALLLGGCEMGTAPGGAQELSLSFSVPTTPARAPAIGMNGLEIRKVQLVVAEVALELQNEIEGCNDDAALCEEFTSGPTLIDLPVNGGLVRPFATAIPSGVYDELEMEFAPPLVIDAGSGPLNVTVAADVAGWFRAADGFTIDPRRMDRRQRRQVEDHIERSFRAFSDANQNGEDDAGEDDRGGDDD